MGPKWGQMGPTSVLDRICYQLEVAAVRAAGSAARVGGAQNAQSAG